MINSKKAQEARNDLFIWYAASFAIVFIFVFALYGFGFFGGVETGGLIDSNKVTAAAIAVPIKEPIKEPELINDSNISEESLVFIP